MEAQFIEPFSGPIGPAEAATIRVPPGPGGLCFHLTHTGNCGIRYAQAPVLRQSVVRNEEDANKAKKPQ